MPLARPASTQEFDYEGEIAVVIGEGGRHIPAQDALAAVAGITCYNDATPRDWMRHSRHFTAAKNFPSTAAIGPWIVTLDSLDDLAAVGIRTRLNGEQMQQGVLGDLTFSIGELVAYVSSFTRLSPGDVIATGTPSGAGYKRAPPRFLVPGDVVEVEVDGVGILSNPVAEASC
jgi:2-keto-4-pentenoate hydratase/2-oxohepta-3-ene-1,7-dioic acid hydratase in catechol pathway